MKEYQAVMAKIAPVFKPLLKPHLDDMEKKVAPGVYLLTWTSMNIDGYLHRFKQVGVRRRLHWRSSRANVADCLCNLYAVHAQHCGQMCSVQQHIAAGATLQSQVHCQPWLLISCCCSVSCWA